jgi:hypothetical protein
VQAAFAPEAAFHVTAARTGWIEFVLSVRPNDAGPQFVDDLEDLRPFVGPDAGA